MTVIGTPDGLALSLNIPPARSPDNADPHPVTVRVHPREVVVGQVGCSPFWWEAECDVDVDHPASCSGYVEECPIADYLDTIGVDRDLLAAFPDPDGLSDDDLDALDGTVRYLTMTRTLIIYPATPNGPTEYDAEYEFAWSD